MGEVWVLVLGLAWGNPDNRTTQVGEVLRIERVMVIDRQYCERAAVEWVRQNMGSSGYTRAFATCAGRAAPNDR